MAALQPDSQESVACAQTTVLPGLSPVTVRDQESHQESDQDAPTVTPQPGGALFLFGLTWEEQATLEAVCVVAGEPSGSDLTVAKLLKQWREDEEAGDSGTEGGGDGGTGGGGGLGASGSSGGGATGKFGGNRIGSSSGQPFAKRRRRDSGGSGGGGALATADTTTLLLG